MSPIDPSFVETAEEFKKGGWIVAVLGALGAFARLVISEEKWQAIVWIRQMIAGAIVGVLVYFAINHSDIDAMYKSVIYSSSGALAPNIFEWIKKKFTNRIK